MEFFIDWGVCLVQIKFDKNECLNLCRVVSFRLVPLECQESRQLNLLLEFPYLFPPLTYF